jgi:hypothetical protein
MPVSMKLLKVAMEAKARVPRSQVGASVHYVDTRPTGCR